MKKLSTMAVTLAAVCMMTACGKQETTVTQVADEKQETTVVQETDGKQETAVTQETDGKYESTESADGEVQTDYANVYWGVSYSIFDDLPGLVVSLTPCMQYDSYGLIVAITNSYSEEMTFAGNAVALDKEGNEIGETYIFEPNIGSGNTVVAVIDCGQSMPDGRVHWTECETMETTASYVPWEADYQVTGNPADECLNVDYSFYVSDGTASSDITLTVCLLDEDGMVIGVGADYIPGIAENEKYTGTISIYGDKDILAMTKGVAMFANPYTTE